MSFTVAAIVGAGVGLAKLGIGLSGPPVLFFIVIFDYLVKFYLIQICQKYN